MIDPAALPQIEPGVIRPAESARAWIFRDEAVLGTRMQLDIVADSFDAARGAALAARAEVDRLNLILNSRAAGSELVRLNASREHTASEDLFAVVAAAERWREAGGGAFSGRLGRVIDLWRAARDAAPSRAELAQTAEAAASARVGLDQTARLITRPDPVQFALDGVAKGYVVDRALAAMRACEGVRGAMADIGGDIAASGEAPENGWIIGVGDPRIVADNAPLMSAVKLSNGAVATSGRGVRDRIIGGRRFSPTLSPFDGWPIEAAISASAAAPSAMEADAMATAALVSGRAPPSQAVWLMDRNGGVASTAAWRNLEAPVMLRAQARPRSEARAGQWHTDWQALATFTAPRRQLIRDPTFRSPYMAMWITTPQNRPVRTLLLIGTRADWQRDNYIWWALNRPAALRLLSGRSMSTSGSGVYNVFWDGVDDAGRPVQAGRYILHVETSRELGKHTYRQMQLDFTNAARFRDVLEPTEEGGGLRVTFDHY
jgi:thiamine biosynthesis lipoprotein